MDAVRKIKVFKSYYKEFYIAQTEAVRKKIDYVIELVKCLEVIPTEYFRKIIPDILLSGQRQSGHSVSRVSEEDSENASV